MPRKPLKGWARLKDISRSKAGVYKRRGKITAGPCCICGEPAQMHHGDYSLSLKVDWFCRPHHLILHRLIDLAEGRVKCR